MGAWSSDRELTLAGLAQSSELSRTYEAALNDPTLFGQNIQIYLPDGAVMWFEGECGQFTPYDHDVLESRPGFLHSRVFDPVLDSFEERTVSWDSEFMRLWMPSGRWYEVFKRVSVPEAVAQHPCLGAAIDPPR
jgi:hypothetical protein